MKLYRKSELAVTLVMCALASAIAIDVSDVLSLEAGPTPRAERSTERPKVSFSDATAGKGLASGASPTWGATWADHDLDGWPDLLVNRHKRKARLFRNVSGRYPEQVSAASFEPPGGRSYYDRHACAWGEADGDGKPDLLCVSGAQKGVGTGANQLLLDDGSEVASGAGLADRYGRGRSLNWIDFDSDGDLDVFIGNQLRDGSPNLTLANSGGRFIPVDIGLSEERATTTSAWSDWDRDGDPDLLVLGQGLRGSSAYENRDGRFVAIQMEGVTGQTWRAAVWSDFDHDGYTDLSLVDDGRVVVLRNDRGRMTTAFNDVLDAGRSAGWLDVENDGDLDLFVVQGSVVPGGTNEADRLYVNRRGRFRSVRAGVSGSRTGDGDAVAVADSDRDGRVDVFVTNGSGEDHRGRWILLGNRSRSAHWIGLRLLGDHRNPFGFGARVRVRSGGSERWVEVTDAATSKVQSDPGYAHVGLGRASRVAITLMWPDGTRDCLRSSPDRVLTVARGRWPCS